VMETKEIMNTNRYPVTVTDDEIVCYAAFHESFDRLFEGEDKTYADIFTEGVKKHWGEAGFKVSIIRVGPDDKRPHIKVLPAKLTNTSYVMSRWWRWGWGLFTHAFHPESFMLNWSKRNPGNIHMNLRNNFSVPRFMRVSAHEFGHVLGLGDAYAAHYRFYFEAPGTEDYMMNRNVKVSQREKEMVYAAQRTGRMQYFPMKISPRTYFKGISENIKKKRK